MPSGIAANIAKLPELVHKWAPGLNRPQASQHHPNEAAAKGAATPRVGFARDLILKGVVRVDSAEGAGAFCARGRWEMAGSSKSHRRLAVRRQHVAWCSQTIGTYGRMLDGLWLSQSLPDFPDAAKHESYRERSYYCR